jgi:hypothetical protein
VTTLISEPATGERRTTGSDGVPSRWYSLFGMPVRSSIDLPLPAVVRPAGLEPAWSFESASPDSEPPAPEGALVYESRCFGPCHGGRVVSRVHRGPSGDHLWHDTVGTFCISSDSRRVTVYPTPQSDFGTLQMFLVGQISTLVLHKRGHPSLHSSAIQTDRGAIVFMGPRGQGKSTMAASFLRSGSTLITDDALPLTLKAGVMHGGPGIHLMKVWPATAEHTLRLTDLPTFLPNYEKKLLTLEGRYELAGQPVPIRAIYILDRYDPDQLGRSDVVIRELNQRDGHAALVAQTSWSELLVNEEKARLLPLYARLIAQARVRRLSYPDGFQFQDMVRNRILADQERL